MEEDLFGEYASNANPTLEPVQEVVDCVGIAQKAEIKRKQKDIALKKAVRLKLKAIMKKSKRTPRKEDSEIVPKKAKSAKIEQARRSIEEAMSSCIPENGMTLEDKAIDAAKRIKNAIKKVPIPRMIKLGECRSPGSDECSWWKEFLGGLQLYPYELSIERVEEPMDYSLMPRRPNFRSDKDYEIVLRLRD